MLQRYANYMKNHSKSIKIEFFQKKVGKNFGDTKKSCTFAPANEIINDSSAKHIGIWCNGNTTDSGPVIPGSSPGIPTSLTLDVLIEFIGIWCNGNTTDSGPVIPGSSPGIPTGQHLSEMEDAFFVCIPRMSQGD